MKRAILTHRSDFIAILCLVGVALAVVIFILEHQPRFTFGQELLHGQGTVRQRGGGHRGSGAVGRHRRGAGRTGRRGPDCESGRAVVTMNIYKDYAPIYRDATVLLRPRTPLKDMYLSLDPGTRAAGAIPNGGTLPLANTQPDINVDQILGSLDADTRNYLLLLLSGGAQAFKDPGNGDPAQPLRPSRICAGSSSASRR